MAREAAAGPVYGWQTPPRRRRKRRYLCGDGNGPYNPQFALDQLGESVVHLIWNPGNPGSLVVADWFTPFRDVDRDGSHKDQDLAAGGVIAL
jgi:hypothetical protein